MSQRKRVLLVGSANMDLSMNVFKVPEAGQTVIDDGGVAYVPGGKGANAAIALQKLGGSCIFCAKLGKDVHGQTLYNYYKETGINTSHIKVDYEAPTGLAVVIKEAGGQNRIITYPGANLTITRDDILEAFEEEPDALYIGFETSFETALTAAKIAHNRNIPIFLDAAPADKDHPLELLPPLEVFSPNETETFEYTGIMPHGSDASLRAALTLYKKVKCKYLVIKQGARGAFIYDGKKYFMIPSYRPDKVVDSTAAGDAFTAALTIMYLESGNINTAVKYGCAAGAITVSREGAGSSVPSSREVMEFIKERQF